MLVRTDSNSMLSIRVKPFSTKYLLRYIVFKNFNLNVDSNTPVEFYFDV